MIDEIIIGIVVAIIVAIIIGFWKYILELLQVMWKGTIRKINIFVNKVKDNFPLYIRRIGKKTIVLKIKKLGLSFDWYLINEEDDTILFKGARYSKEECKIEAYSKIKPLRIIKETHEKLSDTREAWFIYFK